PHPYLPSLFGAKLRYDKAITHLQWSGSVTCTPALVDNHKHVAIADLWSTIFPKPLSKTRGPATFVKAVVEAAGSVPERELLKCFNWPKPAVKAAISELLARRQ